MKITGIISLISNLIAIVLFITGIAMFSLLETEALGWVFVCSGFVFLFVGIFLSRKDRNK